jgi:nucleotide-binding universal stress UspA family protein
MEFRTLLVHVAVDGPNTALLQAARMMAERSGANVMGIGACQPRQLIYNDGYVSGDFIEQERSEIEHALKRAEEEFRNAFRGRGNRLAWRETVTLRPLHEYVAEQARCADLVMTGAMQGGPLHSWTRHANTGALVMQAGRPVMLVPASVAAPELKHAMIAWKDMRETRRAIADALPLLQQATQVRVVEISAEPDEALPRIRDVADWLSAHGIRAEVMAQAPKGEDGEALNRIADEHGVDVIVAGAYGHGRLREWALGGVTRDLLLRPARCAFVSH